MRFGIFLPSFLIDGPDGPSSQRLVAFARHAEELGFDSLWITDHVITARRFYNVDWLDCLMTLSHVASVTERVRLGTSILILPIRQPALLAKQVATLQYLSDNRYVFGIGTGWYGPEFEACGVQKKERGRRTDEVLEATLALMSGPDVHYQGDFYELNGVTVQPHPDVLPPVWSAGGSQLAHERSPETPNMHPNVLKRIANADGWIARPTCPPDLLAIDRKEIARRREELGHDNDFTYAHENFVWVSESNDRDAALHTQQERFSRIVSDERPWDYIASVYFSGTIDDIQSKVAERVEAGVEYMMLHTLTADLEQLDLIARHIVEPFST